MSLVDPEGPVRKVDEPVFAPKFNPHKYPGVADLARARLSWIKENDPARESDFMRRQYTLLFERFETGQARNSTVNGWAVAEVFKQQAKLQNLALKESDASETSQGFLRLGERKAQLDRFQQENNLPRTFEKELGINI